MKNHRSLQNWQNLMIWKETLETLKNDFRKQTNVKFDRVSAVLFLLSWQECSCNPRADLHPRKKRISRGNIIILACGELWRRCADYRFEDQRRSRQVIKNRDPAALLLGCLYPSFSFLFSRVGVETPLTKVNSHDQPLFAGAR